MLTDGTNLAAVGTSVGPGEDGNYSTEWDPEGFKPLIEAAQAAGQYVVLDPEWRLHPGELPLAQIGHVDVDQLDQSRAELAYLIHVDGQGTQEAKASTWRTLLENAPSVGHWGWKNFDTGDDAGLRRKS